MTFGLAFEPTSFSAKNTKKKYFIAQISLNNVVFSFKWYYFGDADDQLKIYILDSDLNLDGIKNLTVP